MKKSPSLTPLTNQVVVPEVNTSENRLITTNSNTQDISTISTYGSTSTLPSSSNTQIAQLFDASSEEKIAAANESLFHIICTKTKKALDSKEAKIYNFSVGLPSIYNEIASTFPGTQHHERLLIMAAAQLLICLPEEFAYLYKKQFKDQSQAGIDNFITYNSYFSNSVGFAFRAGCDVIALTWEAELPTNTEVIGVITALLASSLLLAAGECYGLSLEENSRIRRVTDSLFLSFTLSNLVAQLSRLYNYAPENNEHPEILGTVFNCVSLGAVAVTMCKSLFFPSKNKQMPLRLATGVNMLNDTASVFEAITTKDYAALGVLLAKPAILLTLNSLPLEKWIKPTSKESDKTLLVTTENDSSSNSISPGARNV